VFGAAWEEVMRVAFAMANDSRLDEGVVIETIWSDPENRTESEHIDAITKLAAIGVPNEALWEKTGVFSREEIKRWRAMAAENALLAALSAPDAAPAPTPDTGPVPAGV
jgi:pyrroloquinoline quinone (PQQ) biosynthesis protein C